MPCLLAYKAGERVRLLSRTSRDHAGTFPAITRAVAALPTDALILDGEVCAFDANLVSHMHCCIRSRESSPRRRPSWRSTAC